MNKRNVIIGTNNFGLGPVGKVSSIICNTQDEFNWFACGNEFDLNIFKKNTFVDKLFSKDRKEINKFIKKYNIKYAVIVLDVELSKILMSLGVKIIFVDSLPFMWTQADIDENLLPLDATVYCAQKCINLTTDSKKVLNQIENLRWINPIQNRSNNKYRPFKDEYIQINVGGMHSPIGNGESYIETILIPLVELYNEQEENIIITCGTKAKDTILKAFIDKNIDMSGVLIKTLEQQDFLSTVYNSKIFYTSPGLTTIYETCSLNKPTIILPPQNLSQFYNIEYAKKILLKYKAIDWETEKLNFNYLNKILSKGETYVVDKIYEYITELVDTEFTEHFKNRLKRILLEEYNDKIPSDFVISDNGADDIKIILEEFIKEEENDK